MRLFKYMNHFGVDILRDLRLKVTPPNELNDPFEFSPYLPPGKVTEEHVRRLMLTTSPRELYDEMASSGEKLPPFEHFERILRTVPPNRVANAVPMFQRSYEGLVAANLDSVSQILGLVCFSEEENNILMWSHYTDSHKGILLEFDTSHPYFCENSKFTKVEYSKKRVPFDPSWSDGSPELERHCGEVLCTKNSAWDYEREWRSLFELGECHQTKVDGRTLYFSDIPPDLIVQVVLGYRCPADVQNQVLEAKRARSLSLSVWRAFLHPAEFKVEYEPL